MVDQDCILEGQRKIKCFELNTNIGFAFIWLYSDLQGGIFWWKFEATVYCDGVGR